MVRARLAILAGGISSRMKKPPEHDLKVEQSLVNDANLKAKTMIGVGKGGRPFLDYLMNIFEFQYDMIYPFLEKVPFDPVRNEKELPAAVKMMVDAHPKSIFAYPLSEHVPDLTSKSDIPPVKEYLEEHFANLTF